MSVDIITTHTADAINRLILQYKNADNIKGIITVFANEIQELENVTHAMFLNRTIDNATGEVLDQIGLIVGQLRQGTSDNVYRVRIKFRIGVNISNGTVNEVATLFKLITSSTEVRVLNLDNATIEIQYAPALDPEIETFVFNNMQDVVAGGVQIGAFTETDLDDGFVLGSATGGVFSGKGLGDLNDANIGGELASIVYP